MADKMTDSSAPSTAGGNSRGEMREQQSLQEFIRQNDEERERLKTTLLTNERKQRQDTEYTIKKLSIESINEINYQRTNNWKKYDALVKSGILTQQEMELKVAKATAVEMRRLRLEETQDEIKTRIQSNKNVLADYRQLQRQKKSIEKQLEDKNLTQKDKKKLQQQLKDTQEQQEKNFGKGSKFFTTLKNTTKAMWDEMGFSAAARKQQGEIMDNAASTSEGMKQRLEANPYDVVAQIFTHLEESLNKLVENLSNAIDPLIETYTEYQSSIDARLQGSGQSWAGGNFGFGGISNTLMKAVGNNPYVSLTTLMENVSNAVEQGIAYNIEQRAFLATVSEDIATTFDAFNNNLLRIIRLQQNDTTAARLGLEASLTELFNSYFSDTSYLSDAADSVSSALTEAISQMGAEEGVEFEYVVQKWLGSLYSVGFSDSSVSAIADALGMLGSGDVSGLSGSSMQNLIVMAASRAGLSYADLLTGGLTASNTNQLLQAMVEYLQEIAESDNLVVKSQYAEVFGLTTSDLTAAENLGSTVSSLASEMESYSDTISELYYQMNQLPSRLSVGEMASNLMNNVLYSTAARIASNPITYALWEITDLIESASGGINIPSFSVMGTGFNLNTTATNLMRLGVVGASALGNIGTIINGIASTVYPANMLSALGITSDSSANAITRGSGLSRSTSGLSQSSYSSYVGNTAGSDYSDSVIAQAETSAQSTLDVKTAESTDKTITDIHEYMLEVMDPKLTSMVQMLGVMSGTKVSSGTTWGNFEDSGGAAYNATSVTISNIGETSTTGTNLVYMKSIDANLSALLTLLRNGELNVNANITNDTLSVKVDNYGLTSSRGGF